MSTPFSRAIGAALGYAALAVLGCFAGLIGGICIAMGEQLGPLSLAALALVPAPWFAWHALSDLPDMQWTGFAPVGLVVLGWMGLSIDFDATFWTIPIYGVASLTTAGLIACRTRLCP